MCIAALVAGARYLPADGRDLALALADYWNARLEDWTVAYDTPLARLYGVPGYYVRVAPTQALTDDRAHAGYRAADPQPRAATRSCRPRAQVGVDFLQLVRFGLRRADDPLILRHA